jgi:hypothetical protein
MFKGAGLSAQSMGLGINGTEEGVGAGGRWLMPAVAGVGVAADVADKAFTPDANVQRVAEA